VCVCMCVCVCVCVLRLLRHSVHRQAQMREVHKLRPKLAVTNGHSISGKDRVKGHCKEERVRMEKVGRLTVRQFKPCSRRRKSMASAGSVP
jgi:hypothetical protein